MRPKHNLLVVVAVLLLVLLPVVFAVSFSSGPSLNPSSNISTTDTFSCQFTPSGDGSLTANISWYKYDGSWSVFTTDTDMV